MFLTKKYNILVSTISVLWRNTSLLTYLFVNVKYLIFWVCPHFIENWLKKTNKIESK